MATQESWGASGDGVENDVGLDSLGWSPSDFLQNIGLHATGEAAIPPSSTHDLENPSAANRSMGPGNVLPANPHPGRSKGEPRRPNRKRKFLDNSSKPRLACPFYKHNPRLGVSGACSGPGFRETARLKEHIRRCHSPGEHSCSRCLTDFGDPVLLLQHSRQSEQCPLVENRMFLGQVSLEQALSLKSLKKARADMTPTERWQEIYSVIFPDVDPVNYPAPFYEQSVATTPSNTSELTEYTEYLHNPQSARSREAELKSDLKAHGITDPRTLRMVAQTFRDYQLRDVREFESKRRGEWTVSTMATVSDSNVEELYEEEYTRVPKRARLFGMGDEFDEFGDDE